ncbi:MAG TPA: globin family protein [Anaerolineae bacterium]
MDAKQIELVQKTFEQRVKPISEEAGQVMYLRLFEMEPSLKPLFKGDIKRQGEMLFTAIGLAVTNLNDPVRVKEAATELGKRHAKYGVEPGFYNIFGAALMWSLEQVIGPDFTPEVKAAWAEAYTMLAQTMRAQTHL